MLYPIQIARMDIELHVLGMDFDNLFYKLLVYSHMIAFYIDYPYLNLMYFFLCDGIEDFMDLY